VRWALRAGKMLDDDDGRSDRSSVALRGLVQELRASNDEKQRRVSTMQAELQEMRTRAEVKVSSPPYGQVPAVTVSPERERWESPTRSPHGASPPRSQAAPTTRPPPSSEKWGSASPSADRPSSKGWDDALWSLLESEEEAWESGSVPPIVELEIEDHVQQTCEQRVLQLLELYREVVRRLDTAQTDSRIQVISAVAAKSQEQCAEGLLRELQVAWSEWRDREVVAERDHAQVNAEIEDLQRRIGNLAQEERQVMEQIGRIKSVRLVSQHEMTVLQVELNQVRSGMRQHEAEFLSRRSEDEAKIQTGQEQLETLTRELGLLRQRNLSEETGVREKQTKLLEISRQKTKELENYKRTVLPMIQEYNARRANEAYSVSARCAQLKEMSDRHRQELLDLARPLA
jgi:hypothetical protein